MTTQATSRAVTLQTLVKNNRAAILELLARYGAGNPRLFGSVARGDATEDSDIDLMVDMAADNKDALWELSGLSEDLRQLLGVRVNAVCEKLLRSGVAQTARRDFVAQWPGRTPTVSATCWSQPRNVSPTSAPLAALGGPHDEMAYDAIVRNLELVGEAAGKLSPTLRVGTSNCRGSFAGADPGGH